MQNIIQDLKRQQLIWHASSAHYREEQHCYSSGLTDLDTLLEGGFPRHGVVEIESLLGIGELRLLSPFLASQQHTVALIQPPAMINAAFWRNVGLSLADSLILSPSTKKEALWSAEQCLKSGVCQTALLWQDVIEIHQVKRLQVACERGGSLLFMFRESSHARLSLPISLSLQLTPSEQGICVKVRKRKGGWQRGTVEINYQRLFPQLTLSKATAEHRVIPFPVALQG
ncbi:translesion DNA synthesis-associated protein ImuA [Vibrio sp. IRLE0018]|uniref:translesion DNA synthesis-associated protein ImuA n=1 Tax=Vibrio floridensis TaxID=2908007 RepID=UPI001A1E469B|nr:translesion DNA synthesis-associated protein ImuA [Vibrio floridensis]MCF8778218.1 translesion DNA synthesis-associated protein ImuA [Vibrio floridensis]HAS6348481.1 translesion DNA synthesis-associated protein ImuA [Vibrio vulnificus]